MKHMYFLQNIAGPSQRARFRAGSHEADNSLYTGIYDEVEAEVAQRMPGLSGRDFRLEVKQIFRERHYVPDQKSQVLENSELTEYGGAEFEIRDGEVYFPLSGRTLNELHERARNLKPEIYSPQAHETDRMVQKALVSGAKEVTHVSYYKNTRGEERIRDTITFVSDGKKGRQVVNNIAPDGNHYSMDEARIVLREQHGTATEISGGEKVFIFVKTHSSPPQKSTDRNEASIHGYDPREATVRAPSVARAQRNEIRTQEDLGKETARETSDIRYVTRPQVRDIVTKTHDTVLLLDTYRRREVSERVENIPIMDQIRRLFHADKDSGAGDKESASSERAQVEQEMRGVKRDKTGERLTLGKIREKPVLVREVIQRHHVEMKHTVRALAIVAETRVAIGAVPLLIATLAEAPPLTIRGVAKSVRRHEEKLRRKVSSIEYRVSRQMGQEPRTLSSTIEKAHKRMRRNMALVRVIAETRVGSAAAPVLLASLAKEQPRAIRATEKSIGRHTRKELRRRKKEAGIKVKEKKLIMRSEKKQKSRKEKKGLSGRRKEKLLTRRIERKRLSKVEAGSGKREAIRARKEIQKERKIIRVLEKKGIKGKEKVLWIAFSQLTRRTQRELRIRNKELGIRKPREKFVTVTGMSEKSGAIRIVAGGKKESFVQHPVEPVRAEQKVTIQFAYSWVLWMLLSPPERSQIREIGEVIERKLSPAESVAAPWILLGIIYYLNAIREQGMHGYQLSAISNQPTGRKKTKKSKRARGLSRVVHGRGAYQRARDAFPAYGVVYAFGLQ